MSVLKHLQPHLLETITCPQTQLITSVSLSLYLSLSLSLSGYGPRPEDGDFGR